MKRLVSAIVTIAFLIYPSICLSAYIIQLKNGGKFITYKHWEKGGEIKFHIYGGVVGIGKDLVQGIQRSDLPYKEEVVEQKASQTPEMAGKEPVPETDMTSEGIDTGYYKNAKKELMEKYRKAKKKLDQAIIDRNKLAKREAKKEIKELHDQISTLSTELKEKNKGVLPVWW